MLPWDLIVHNIIHVVLPTSTGATCVLFLQSKAAQLLMRDWDYRSRRTFTFSFICNLKTGEIRYGFYLFFCHFPYFAKKKQNIKLRQATEKSPCRHPI